MLRSLTILLITLSTPSIMVRAQAQNYYYCTHERIVTSLLEIDSPDGMPLDFRYNETTQHNGELASAPGCPKSIDGYPWIYYDKRCYLAGRKGPCSTGQVLFIQPETDCGVCGCECLLSDTVNTAMPSSQNDLQKYQLCYAGTAPHGQIYDKTDKTVCFNIHEQGPCLSGKFLSVITPPFSESVKDYSPSIGCLPPCDLNDDSWSTKNYNGECALTSGGGFASGAGFLGNILGNNCLEEERYSEVLRKCVKKRPNLSLVIG